MSIFTDFFESVLKRLDLLFYTERMINSQKIDFVSVHVERKTTE